ncbi:ADP-ribosylglycohydrolase family protein [uncultured Microscilla sp.]|uniref:ADP-ribosylglycohydrolase family protein n=1 Tax=uncultured Microscilla sp. TaxID=432653 RepID=UPI0026378D40|nr:ADP-ribosylglycohydrolase family protein [uncultured Microscilla sp.]
MVSDISLDRVKGFFMGLATGDALGIPAEFQSRQKLSENPVTGMRKGGIYGKSAGIWSTDGSLTFCVAESLLTGFNLHDIAKKFVDWLYHNYWTADGEVFDVGVIVAKAIQRIKNGTELSEAGGNDEMDNGNGALNYTLPLGFHTRTLSISERFIYIEQLSSLTNRHLRSIIGAFIFSEMAIWLMRGGDIDIAKAYAATTQTLNDFIKERENLQQEAAYYQRVLDGNLKQLPVESISSTAYVVDSIEACFWCLLNTNNYQEAVLKTVNLGEDADTIGAMTGALAGLYYGYEAIPTTWKSQVARKDDIIALSEQFYHSVASHTSTN